MKPWMPVVMAALLVGCFDEAAVQVEADALAGDMASRAEVDALAAQLSALNEELEAAVSANAALQATSDALAVDVAANASAIATNASDAATIAADVASNAAGIVANALALTATDGDLVAAAADIATLETNQALVFVDIATLETNQALALADIDTLESNQSLVFIDIAALESSLAIAESDIAGRVQRIESDVTVTIDQTLTADPDNWVFTSLDAALDALDGFSVDRDVLVTLQLATGYAESRSTPIALGHADGDRMELYGDGDPLTVEFTFAGGHGVALGPGQSFRLIDGVVLQSTDGTTGSGVNVTGGGSLQLGADVVLDGFFDGAYVAIGGVLTAPGVSFLNSTRGGVVATDGGVAYVIDSLADGSGSSGYSSGLGAFLRCQGATAANSSVNGFTVFNGGLAQCEGAVAQDNAANGFYVSGGAVLNANASSALDNGGDGYFSALEAVCTAGGSTSTGNGAYGYNAISGGFLNVTPAVAPTGNTSGSWPFTPGAVSGVLFQ